MDKPIYLSSETQQKVFDFFSDNHGISLLQSEIENIVSEATAWVQEALQETFETETRIAIDAAGGCSQCGGLDGYSCVCDYDEDHLIGWVDSQ